MHIDYKFAIVSVVNYGISFSLLTLFVSWQQGRPHSLSPRISEGTKCD